MRTLFHITAQLVFLVIALFVAETPGQHSYDRPGTRLAFGVVAACLGWQAHKRFVSRSHTSHRYSRKSAWVVMA